MPTDRLSVLMISALMLALPGMAVAFDVTSIGGDLTRTVSNTTETGSCSDAGYNTVSQFCYDSGFPLRIAGNSTVSGSDVPEPPGVTQQSECKCGQDPYAIYGYTKGMWLPTRMVEVVRRADCSPVYGEAVQSMLGQMANVAGSLTKTTLTAGDSAPIRRAGFRHYHSWEFPLYDIYGWTPRCFYRGDELETSISSPTWSRNDAVWMNLLYPEWGLIGSMSSAAGALFDLPAHAASCVANTTGIGTMADDALYWLGGCMGKSLPAAGSYSSEKNSVISTSTILNRSIMYSNRSGGFASVSTVGDKALCTPVPVPYPSKSEFKATMLFPYPESGEGQQSGGGFDSGSITGQLSGEVASFLSISSRCAHRLGASPLRWGMGRSDQAADSNDSDAVYLLWRWVDCCEFGDG